MARISESAVGTTSLASDLLEQVRRTLAQGHGCEYCMTRGGPPDAIHEALRTSLAVGLAQVFTADHRAIDERQLDFMREYFTEPELVELIAFMGFMWAGGTFGKVFDIVADTG